MSLRSYVLTLLSILAAVVLIQMGVSWRIASNMGDTLRDSSGEIIDNLGTVIRKNEAERVSQTLLASSSDLQVLIQETEVATRLVADFVAAQGNLAKISEDVMEKAREEVAVFCRNILDSRLPTLNGVGATFERNAFSTALPFFLPYAYREDAGIDYSDGVIPPDDHDPGKPITQEFSDRYLEDELSAVYYTTAVPKGHDRSRKLPEAVNWSEPYIDAVTHETLISAATPMHAEGRVVGVAFSDLSVGALNDLTEKMAKAITPGTVALAFGAASGQILAAPGQPELAPRETNEILKSGEKVIKPATLADALFGSAISDAFAKLKPSGQTLLSLADGDRDYTVFVENIHNLFGLAILVPDDELFAETRKAKLQEEGLNRTQAKEMRILAISGIVSLVLVLITLAVIIVFIVRITRRLNLVIDELSQDADSMGRLAGEVSVLSQSLGEASIHQTQSLGGTSDAVGRITEQIKANANASEECGQAMSRATQQVDSGTGSVTEMGEAMDAISGVTEQITQTLKSIESIAFQTNLLALNAAVEASRAGEAGAGFAVVADEVRNLAGRTAEASRHTNTLIEQATQRVAEGMSTTERLQAGFKDIEEAVNAAAKQVDRIRAATREQAEDVDVVTRSMADLNTTVQKNEETASRSADTASSLSAQAESLNGTAGDLDRLTRGTRR